MHTKNPDYCLTNTELFVTSPDKICDEEKKHSIQVEDKKLDLEIEDKRWRSCCFELHSESSLFFAKLSVSMVVITLCSYQLVTLRDCNYQSLYSSLLSSVITFWLSKK